LDEDQIEGKMSFLEYLLSVKKAKQIYNETVSTSHEIIWKFLASQA